MRAIYLLAVALLPACQPASEGEDAANGDAGVNASAFEAARILPTPNSIEAEANGMRGEGATADLSSEDNWIGRFAATTELCRGGAWDIGETRIVTDSGTVCDIDRVGRGPQQVTLRLACSAEGTSGNEEWVLTPNQRNSMRVRRDDGRQPVDVDLIRCS